MKLLLTRDIPHLGIVGDVVEVSSGYARNHLLPERLATQATKGNMRALAEERQRAEQRKREAHEALTRAAERIRDVEVTISAAANEEGVLYGSVGPREIAAALREEGHDVDASNIELPETIHRLDKLEVTVKFSGDITSQVKVWVVRSEGTPLDSDEAEDGDGYGSDSDS